MVVVAYPSRKEKKKREREGQKRKQEGREGVRRL